MRNISIQASKNIVFLFAGDGRAIKNNARNNNQILP